MALGPRLDLRQSQQLVMTPQLQQAIKLLALTNLEIEAFVSEELERNPLLEVQQDEERGRDSSEHESSPAEEQDGDGESFEDEPATADHLLEAGDERADAPLDVDYEAETFHHDSVADSGSYGMDGGLGLDAVATGGFDGEDGFETTLSASISLHDHLAVQAGAAFEGADLLIASHIIDLIDESGYLTGHAQEVADRLGAPITDVERILAEIQTFDPSGVGACSLSECLAIQAREADRLDPAMARLLDNLDLLARGELASLRRICGVDQEDLGEMIRELRDYNPKPGLQFGGERVQTVVPDVFIAKTRTGWAVELNSATLPRVLINRRYYAELTDGKLDKTQRAFLSDCLASANWLVKALDQRARTIVKVATALVTAQQAFFENGVSHLKPLTLKQVADEVGMHESTISRVTSNKFLSCDRGIYELKYFFTSGIQSADGGEAVSAHAVKDRIKTLIGAEDADSILSDDKLVELLREEGFDIARRTVAKYREALGIGSSVQRRRQKLLASTQAA
jgi:RNA polymerase sigma-54 factor